MAAKTGTYTLIASTTLSSDAAYYDFTSIPTTYTDLIITSSAATVSSSDITFRVGNGSVDAGTNYSTTWLHGTGSTAGSDRGTNIAFGYFDYYGGANATLGNNVAIAHFMDYANTNTYKTILARSNNATSGVDALVNLWRSTSAINIIRVIGASANIKTGSTFKLYGIEAGN